MTVVTVDEPDTIAADDIGDADTPGTAVAIRDTAQQVGTWDEATRAVVIPTPVGGMTLEFREGQKVLDAKQMMLLEPLGIKADWSPSQVQVFLMLCLRRGFDPWNNEAYLMRYNAAQGSFRYVRHIGIGGFERKAEESRRWEGTEGPSFTGDGDKWLKVWPYKAPPLAARSIVYKAGFRVPAEGVALYEEFVPLQDEYVNNRRTGKRVPVPMWRMGAEGGKGTHMLGKCSKAVGYRLAFPGLNGWYLAEEFDRVKAAEPARTPTPLTVEVGEKLRTAYAAANPGQVIDGEAEEVTPDTGARALLLAEAGEQAEVLGRSLAQLTARWVASHQGRPFEQATVTELRDFVHRCRPYVVTALRDAHRDDEADRYAVAPDTGTLHELFGRGPAVPEPEGAPA